MNNPFTENPDTTYDGSMKLKVAVGLYWKYLLGVIFFLPILLVLAYFTKENSLRPLLFIALFFGVTILASWPQIKYKAPYSFWILASILFFLSPILWTVLFFLGAAIYGILFGQ